MFSQQVNTMKPSWGTNYESMELVSNILINKMWLYDTQKHPLLIKPAWIILPLHEQQTLNELMLWFKMTDTNHCNSYS